MINGDDEWLKMSYNDEQWSTMINDYQQWSMYAMLQSRAAPSAEYYRWEETTYGKLPNKTKNKQTNFM